MAANQVQPQQSIDAVLSPVAYLTKDLKPAELRDALVKALARLELHPEEEFPQGRGLQANQRGLIGIPFLIVSPWIERREDLQVFTSGKSYPAHQVIQLYIRTVDPKTYAPYDVELATFAGEYLLNQFRNATPDQLMAMQIWTIWPNPGLSLAKWGKPDEHPLMLCRWNPNKHRGVYDTEPSAFDEPTPTDARLSEIAGIRPVVPGETEGDRVADKQTVKNMRQGREARADRADEQRKRDEQWIEIEQLMADERISRVDVEEAAGWSSINGKAPDAILTALRLLIRQRELAKAGAGKDVIDAIKDVINSD